MVSGVQENNGSIHRRLQRHLHKRKIRVLHIEDKKSDIVLIKKMLADSSFAEQYEVVDVPRLEEAKKRLIEEYFDLILLDLNVLDSQGANTVVEMTAAAPGIPILVCSADRREELPQKVLVAGATHFMSKDLQSAYSLKFMIQQALLNPTQ